MVDEEYRRWQRANEAPTVYSDEPHIDCFPFSGADQRQNRTQAFICVTDDDHPFIPEGGTDLPDGTPVCGYCGNIEAHDTHAVDHSC